MTTYNILLETTQAIHKVEREIRAIKRYKPDYVLDRDEFCALICENVSFCKLTLSFDDDLAVSEMILNAHKQAFA